METVDFYKVKVDHPPCWVEEYGYVARIISTVEKGLPGAGAWVEVWNGARWTLLEFKTPGLFKIGEMVPLMPSEVEAYGVPTEPFPLGYNVPDQCERDFWESQRMRDEDEQSRC